MLRPRVGRTLDTWAGSNLKTASFASPLRESRNDVRANAVASGSRAERSSRAVASSSVSESTCAETIWRATYSRRASVSSPSEEERHETGDARNRWLADRGEGDREGNRA